MSGGVDSSTAAALLKNQGTTWSAFRCNSGISGASTSGLTANLCPADAVRSTTLYDARVVASKLSFPFYVVNLEDEFERDVVRPFVTKYLNGLTPSPCVTSTVF